MFALVVLSCYLLVVFLFFVAVVVFLSWRVVGRTVDELLLVLSACVWFLLVWVFAAAVFYSCCVGSVFGVAFCCYC